MWSGQGLRRLPSLARSTGHGRDRIGHAEKGPPYRLGLQSPRNSHTVGDGDQTVSLLRLGVDWGTRSRLKRVDNEEGRYYRDVALYLKVSTKVLYGFKNRN